MKLLDQSNINNSRKELYEHYHISCKTDIPSDLCVDKKVIKTVSCLDDFNRPYVYTIKSDSNMLLQQCVKNYFDAKYDSIFNTNSYKKRPGRHVSQAIADIYRLINLSKMKYCLKIEIKDINKSKAFIKRKLNARGVSDRFLFRAIDAMGEDYRDEYILRDTYINILLSDFDDWLDSQWRVNPAIYKTKSYVTSSGAVNYGNSYKKMRNTNLKEFYFVRYGNEICIFSKDFDVIKKVKCACVNYLNKHYKNIDFKTNLIDLTAKSLYFDVFRIKIKNSKACSFIQDDVCLGIYKKLKQSMKEISKAKSIKDMCKDVYAYNDLVDFYKDYCNVAMNVSVDFHSIHDKMRISFYNMLTRNTHIKYGSIGSCLYLTESNIKVQDIGSVRYRKPKCLSKNVI